MRLHVRVFGPEKFFRTLNRECFDFVDEFAAAVPTFSRIALRVLIGQHAALRFHHGREREVFRRDQLDVILLARKLRGDRGVDLWVEGLERRGVDHGEPTTLAQSCAEAKPFLDRLEPKLLQIIYN